MSKVTAILLLIAAAPELALAAESVMVVGMGGCEDPVLAEQVRTVRKALIQHGGLVVQPEDDTSRLLGGSPKGSIAGVRRLLSDAQSEFMSSEELSRNEAAAKARRAQELVETALDTLRSLPPSAEHDGMLLEIWAFQLQQLYSGASKRKDLDRVLESIFRVSPQFAFDPNLYSPPQIEHYEDVRNRVRSKGTATLSLSARQQSVLFYLDGYKVGPAPLVLRVPPGKYRVQAAWGANHGLAHEVVVQDQAEIAVDGELEGLVRLEYGPCLAIDPSTEMTVARLARLGSLVGVQVVVGIHQDRTREGVNYLAVETVDVSSGHRRGGAAIKVVRGRPVSSELRGLWDLLGSSSGAYTVSAPESTYLAPLPAQRTPSASWMRPAAWVAGGLALGLAGLATYQGISARNSYRKADGMLQPDGTVTDRIAYDKFNSDGDGAKKAMYLSAGVAVLLAGTAGVLGYISREPGPPVIRF